MAIYSIAIIPLIHQHEDGNVWFADNATVGGSISTISRTGGIASLYILGPKENVDTIQTLQRPGSLSKKANWQERRQIVRGWAYIHDITVEGKRHLGATISTRPLLRALSSTRSQDGFVKWSISLPLQPPNRKRHMYAAFTQGLISKWTYLVRTIPDIEGCYQITILTVTYRPECIQCDIER